ncbi:MAG: M66 family metalloprotease [Paucimonas sp.]|jgi:hypothetical protein|nr:M66 family metalloprotease [Paucimonas sp.]
MSAANTIAFNDQPLKDDLRGSLQGSVLCAQTSIIPSRASALPDDPHPRLVAQRDTLVMFKPQGDETLPFITLQVIAADGALLYSAPMNPPSALPQVGDGGLTSGGKQIVYGDNFWTYRLPWCCIVPGIRLLFGSALRSGYYYDVDVGAPGELVIHTIDLGMLTAPQDMFTSFSADRQRQFFQQTPCSRLVVNIYEPVHLKEIVMPDGTQYTDRSTGGPAAGSTTGDLRQRIGKELVGLGIHNANLGIYSSPGIGEGGLNKHQVASQLVGQSSVGVYTEGVVVHGKFGGGGIFIAKGYTGSDFSQPAVLAFSSGATASFKNSIHRSAGNPNSTWGWDSDNNVFLPNFEKKVTGAVSSWGDEGQAPFHGHCFGLDVVAGGWTLYPAALAYPLLTPYTLNKVQSAIESRVVFDKASKTGYSLWSEKTRSMEPWAEFVCFNPTQGPVDEAGMRDLVAKYRLFELSMWPGYWTRDAYMPAAGAENKGRGVRFVQQCSQGGNVHINGEVIKTADGDVLNFESDGSKWVRVDDFSFNVAREPKSLGVPVCTILGYYDPQGKLRDYIYGPLYAGYGNVFKPDRPIETKRAKCWLEVQTAKGDIWGYVLRSVRGDSGAMNRLHINVPQSINPVSVTLYRDGKAVLHQALTKPTGKARVTFHGCN